MNPDKEAKIASWVVVFILTIMSLILLVIAIKGIFEGAVPTISKYSPNRLITGTRGVLLGVSYIGLSISGFLGSVYLRVSNERNRYGVAAKIVFISSMVVMFMSLIF